MKRLFTQNGIKTKSATINLNSYKGGVYPTPNLWIIQYLSIQMTILLSRMMIKNQLMAARIQQFILRLEIRKMLYGDGVKIRYTVIHLK